MRHGRDRVGAVPQLDEAFIEEVAEAVGFLEVVGQDVQRHVEPVDEDVALAGQALQ